MQSAKKKDPKFDDRNGDTERFVRPRLESGYELTAHRSIEDLVDPFVDPIASVDMDPFDRALIDSFAFEEDDLVVEDAAFFGDDDEDDTVRMERPSFEPTKK